MRMYEMKVDMMDRACSTYNKCGLAIVQAVFFFFAETQFQSQGSPCGISGGQSGIHSTIASHSPDQTRSTCDKHKAT
jgi:hypothetical protein